MKPRNHRRLLYPAQAAKFLEGSVTARLTIFSGVTPFPKVGERLHLSTLEGETFEKGSKCVELGAVILSAVQPVAIDRDFLILGKVRYASGSDGASFFAVDCGFSSFESLCDSLGNGLPFIGHVLQWPSSKQSHE